MNSVTLKSLSRRKFLEDIFSTAAFVLAAQIVPTDVWAQDRNLETRADGAALHPGARRPDAVRDRPLS